MTGSIQKITASQLQFISGSIYKIDAKTDFAELQYRGSFIVESVSAYPSSLFRGLAPGQTGFGNLVSLASLLNPTPPMVGFGASQGKEGEIRRNTYDVEAEIHLSCRVEDGNAEIEVDNVKPVKIAARQ